MNRFLPAGAPATSREAFAVVNAAVKPDTMVLKLMVLLEASGLGGYGDMAAACGQAEAAALLNRNGREELAHAHRVRQAIRALTGEEVEIPSLEDNPYYVPARDMTVTRAMLAKIAAAEFGGEKLYETWAAEIGNDEAAALFRLNGREEAEHGARVQQAAALLPA